VWGSEFTITAATPQGGGDNFAQTIVRSGARCASQVLLPAAPLIVRRRYLIVVPRPMPAAPRMYLAVVYRSLPAAPLVVRCIRMAVVPRPMPVAVTSRCYRRRFQLLRLRHNKLACGSMLCRSRRRKTRQLCSGENLILLYLYSYLLSLR